MSEDMMLVAALVVLVMLSVGGLAYAFFFNRIASDTIVGQRLEAVTERDKVAQSRRAAGEMVARKKNIQGAFKEFEARQQAKAKQTNSPTLTLKMEQAGLRWTRQTFVIISIIVGILGVGVAYWISPSPLVAVGAGIIAGLGLPRWYIGFKRKRRMAAFIAELPNAVDVIVRGIRSGLPLGDCLRIIASEAREPVRSEFRQIVEAQQVGVTVGDACMKLYEHMPVQEANFFGIVIQIQQKAGGNLSETLGNLSKVLRERKKMQAKIKAVSQEAKASAAIIGSLPLLVGGLVSITSPDYIKPLFTTNAGNVVIGIGAFMMFCGIMVMKKMINFDF